MTLSTQSSGQEPEELLDSDERYAVNEVCKKLLRAWETADEPCDMVDLIKLLNAGSARAVLTVRNLKKLKA